MKVMIKIPDCSKQEAMEHLCMGVEYKQRGNDTFAWYWTKAYALEDIRGWKDPKDIVMYKGWDNEDFITLRF